MNPIPWTIDRLIEMYPTLKTLCVTGHPEMSPQTWLSLFVKDRGDRGLYKFVADKYGVYGCLLFRPVNLDIIAHARDDYWGHIEEFDPEGDICAVDFAYGPGLYNLFIRTCKETRKEWIAYEHRGRFHLVKMHDMPD